MDESDVGFFEFIHAGRGRDAEHGSLAGFLTVIKKMARPTFEPTTEQRVQVQTLAEYGAPEAHIATKLGIAKNTLSKYFAAELEAGQQEAKLQVGTFILDSILGRGGIRDERARATLAIFYAKTRMGWKETSNHWHGEAPPDTDAALEALTRGLDRIAARKGEEQTAASVPEEQRRALQWDWRYWGRLEQQPPPGE